MTVTHRLELWSVALGVSEILPTYAAKVGHVDWKKNKWMDLFVQKCNIQQRK